MGDLNDPAVKRAFSILERRGFSLVVNQTVMPSVAAPRTFATKAERAAGNGFACPRCNRRDLRVAPVAGRSFHEKDFRGNRAELCDWR